MDITEAVVEGGEPTHRILNVPFFQGDVSNEKDVEEAVRQAALPTGRLDKYRRVLATLTIDGEDLGGLLVKNGLARWYGGERRPGWCGEP